MNYPSIGGKGRIFLRLCFIVLLLLPATSRADDWTYTLRPGDELWSVAKQFCGSARLANNIAAHNNIGNPALVRAGMRIRIPTAWLAFAPTGATLVELSGEVAYLPDSATTTPREPAKLAQNIAMGATLATLEGSALVQFADGSTLTIQPHSRVLFNKLTAFGPAGMVDTHLRFSYGNGTTTVKPQNRGDRFRIETPEGIAAVRGTQFRVGYKADSAVATTETLEGEVAFITNKQTTSLPSGFGVAASPVGLVKEALLPPPIIEPEEEYAFDSTLNWQPVAGARAYTLVWARQQNPDITVRISQHRATTANIELPPGAYIARLRAVSEAGIAGEDGLKAIQVLASAPRLVNPQSPLVGTTPLSWHGRDGVQSDVPGYLVEITNELTLKSDTTRTSGTEITANLSPGNYKWRVRDEQSAWSETASFTVLPSPPNNLAYSRKRKSLTLSWEPVAEAEEYVVVVQHSNGTSKEIETSETQLTLEVDNFGMHNVSVSARHQELYSSTSTIDVLVTRRPWWLLALTLLAFAL